MDTSDVLSRSTGRDGTVTLTLNRPHRHNALNDELVQALTWQLQAIAEDDGIRVVILTGAGASFCGGADIKEMQQATDQADRLARQLAGLLYTLYRLPQASIARVNGPAYGGGIGLMTACDFAVTHDQARFAFTETRRGLVPAIIAPYVIGAMGLRRTQQYFLSGETINAEQALSLVWWTR